MVNTTEQIITTFAGPDAPTWDASEVEAWYRVARRIHREVIENFKVEVLTLNSEV